MRAADRIPHPLRGWLPAIEHDAFVVEQQVREGRFQRWLALIAGFASLLSGYEAATEHYRAGYGLQVMYTPVIISPLLLVAGIAGFFSRRAARIVLPLASLLTIVDGLAGTYFHIRNIARRPGGWRLPVTNLVMGPPLFAPVLFTLSGYLGIIASLLRRADDPDVMPPRPAWLAPLPPRLSDDLLSVDHEVREGHFQQHLAVVAGLTALLSGLEAGYLHYKNAYRYRIEWTPLVLAPLMGAASLGTVWSRLAGRTVLPAASVVATAAGTVGTFYHARGVLRRPGALKLGAYNVLYGPPLFAPLLLAASGFMGLVASFLRRSDG